VTDVCKEDFCALMNNLVLSACMPHSTYEQPLPKDRSSEIAAGYFHYNLQVPGGYNINPELSAAGLWTTPSDLARFGIEIIKALKGESDCLKKETAQRMTTKAYENSPNGLGFAVNSCKKGAAFGHGGDNIGYHATMVFCPEDGSGIVVMQNADIGMMIRNEVVNAFKELYGW